LEGGRYGTICAKNHMNRLLQWAGKPEMDYRDPFSITTALENVRAIIDTWAEKVGTESLGERAYISWHLCEIIRDNLPSTEVLAKASENASHWIFQGNPKFFDVDQYLRSRTQISWSVNQHQSKIQVGDKVLFWRSGPDGGVIAECIVETRPVNEIQGDAPELYRNPEDAKGSGPSCKLRVLSQYVDNAISREKIKAALPSLTIIRFPRAVNYPITESDFNTILSLKNAPASDSSFKEILRRYHAEQIIFSSSVHNVRYAISGWDDAGVSVARLDTNEPQRVTFAQAQKLIHKVREQGQVVFTELDHTSAVRNAVLQDESLALTADQKNIAYLQDTPARLQNFLAVMDQLQTSNRLYKPAMLLCVLDGLDSGNLPANRIAFDWIAPRFIAKLKELGKDVTESQAAMPFYHLTGDRFWLHAVTNPQDMMQDGGDGPNAVRKKINYALLKDTYWNLLQDPASRLAVRIKLETLLMPTPEEFLSAAETAIKETGFQHPPGLVRRFLAALAAKPFVILTGNSGTGKTQLAKIIAEWLSPIAPAPDADPFRPGAVIESDRIKYYVHNADTQSVEFWNSKQEDDAIKVTLPRQMIREWADAMLSLNFTQETPARTIREAVVAQSKFSSQLHSFETHLKAAALALLNAQPAPKGESLPTLPRYALVPVGADWTDNRNVVGFVNHLRKDGQQNPIYQSTPVLDLLLWAVADPQRPYFLILDEMNLSHVERYFADFLSAMESKKPIPLHNEIQTLRTPAGDIVPPGFAFPENLFVIGTVNVDETTYMFSPKVLDRANVLEFRIGTDQAKTFLSGSILPVKAAPPALGVSLTFLSLSRRARGLTEPSLASPPDDALLTCRQNLQHLFELLHSARLEFAYRTIAEITRYFQVDFQLAPDKTAWLAEPCLDAQILQKILPKIHGSRRRLEAILIALATYCEKRDLTAAQKPLQREADLNSYPPATQPNEVAFPLSRTKLLEMLDAVRRDQFVSFIQ
jgi:hypothetical protein